VLVSRSGLVTVTGGKWTTYRAMAEDVLEKCFDKLFAAASRSAGVTTELALVGAGPAGASRPAISAARAAQLWQRAATGAAAARRRHAWRRGLTEAMVRFAARHEYARTVEDVLARRSGLLFLDAAGAAGWPGGGWPIVRRGDRSRTRRPGVPALAQEYLHSGIKG
jgi:glycerol-3-phosphate dehydrogenase